MNYHTLDKMAIFNQDNVGLDDDVDEVGGDLSEEEDELLKEDDGEDEEIGGENKFKEEDK